MIGEVLTWWGQQLLSLVPARGWAGQRDAVLATQRGGSLDVSVRRRGRLGALGAFPLTDAGAAALATALSRALGPRRAPLELQLPEGTMLDQGVTLPLAAERDPDSVLRYEMDRLTPFAADQLYWTWAVLRRDRARAQLDLRLTLVVRAQVDPVIDVLRRAGLSLRALVGEGDRIIPLDAARPGPWRQRGAAALAGVCGLLAVAAVAIPFVQQSWAGQRIEQTIAALRPAVDRVDALRRGMSQAVAGVDVLAAQRARLGDPLAAMAALTDILPDDTVLTDLAMRQRVLALTGQSAAAARLIPALAADPALRDPAFTAPVTRNGHPAHRHLLHPGRGGGTVSAASRLPTGRAGQALALLLLLVVAAAAWAAVVSPLLDWHADRADLLERRSTLARRMAQVAADLPRLQQQAAAGTQVGPQTIVPFEGRSDAVAGAALQQRLQDMAATAGTSLSSIEALPPLQMGAYRQVGVRVAINAPWAALVAFLRAIEDGSPQMLVDELQIHGAYGLIREANAPLTASLAVMGFRAGAPGP